MNSILLNLVAAGDKNRNFWADYLNLDGVVVVAIISAVTLISLYYWLRIRKK